MSKNSTLQDLVGRYEVLTVKNKNYALKYVLIINDSAQFSLDKQISGQFGSGGLTWEGRIVPDPQLQRFVLQVEKCIDWSYTFLDEERSERETIVKKIFTLISVSEGVQVEFESPSGTITLKPVPVKKVSKCEKKD